MFAEHSASTPAFTCSDELARSNVLQPVCTACQRSIFNLEQGDSSVNGIDGSLNLLYSHTHSVTRQVAQCDNQTSLVSIVRILLKQCLTGSFSLTNLSHQLLCLELSLEVFYNVIQIFSDEVNVVLSSFGISLNFGQPVGSTDKSLVNGFDTHGFSLILGIQSSLECFGSSYGSLVSSEVETRSIELFTGNQILGNVSEESFTIGSQVTGRLCTVNGDDNVTLTVNPCFTDTVCTVCLGQSNLLRSITCELSVLLEIASIVLSHIVEYSKFIACNTCENRMFSNQLNQIQ